jgi:hypothetical protein
MPAYLVLSATESCAAPISFDDLGAAVTWCSQQTTGQRFKVVEVPNERGNLVTVNVATLKAVWVR